MHDYRHIWVNGRQASKQKKTSDRLVRGFEKSGDDLLSRFRSTIGADGLNFSVRNGKRWFPIAKVTLRHSRMTAE